VPVWLIDRKIPSIQARAGIHEIQMPATEGIKELLKALL
jgi:hypothetical protein